MSRRASSIGRSSVTVIGGSRVKSVTTDSAESVSETRRASAARGRHSFAAVEYSVEGRSEDDRTELLGDETTLSVPSAARKADTDTADMVKLLVDW